MNSERQKDFLAWMKENPDTPPSIYNGCTCDFCTRKKLHSDNWCPWCAKVVLPLGKWWENMDQCDVCESAFDTESEGTVHEHDMFDLGGEG